MSHTPTTPPVPSAAPAAGVALTAERLEGIRKSLDNLNSLQRRFSRSAPLAGSPGTSWSDLCADLLAAYDAQAARLSATEAALALEKQRAGRRVVADDLPPDGVSVAVWYDAHELPNIACWSEGGEHWVSGGTYLGRRAFTYWQALAR